jgi:hypothetical protein
MAIVSSELVYYASAVVNDTASNGGRISANEVVSGSSNVFWPNVPEGDLLAGVTQWRKGFVRVDNAANETASVLRVGLWRPTPGDDMLYLALGTQTNIQSAFGTPDLYGVGQLNASVLTGVNEIAVLVEDGAVPIFRNGGLIRISNETSFGTGGTAEIRTINGTPSVVGNVVTITITGTLANDYSNTNTFVSSLIHQTAVKGDTTGKVVTSVAGTFTEANMTVGNLGSIYQTLTFTFTSATAFTVASDAGITLAGGTTDSTYAPTNVSKGASYFSIPPSCWGGTWANGNTLVIVTVPPAVPILEKRVVPASATAFGSQSRGLMFFVES